MNVGIHRRETHWLFIAANEGDLKTVNEMLDAGANPNGYQWRNPLNAALLNGHLDIVHRLLSESDINVNLPSDKTEHTPLFLAIERDYKDVVEHILSKPDVQINRVDAYGRTALFYSLEYENPEIARILLDYPGININQPDKDDFTPLYMAAQEGYTSLVERLLSMDEIDVIKSSKTGENPLMIAIHNGHNEIVEMLLKTNAKDLINIYNPVFEATLLSDAVNQGNAEIVKMLLDAGANPTQSLPVNVGGNVLMIAIHLGHKEIVEILLNSNAKELLNTYIKALKTTPLLYAADLGQTEIVKVLLEAGADPSLHIPKHMTVRRLAELRAFEPEINKAILKDIAKEDKKWIPKTKSDVELFDDIFKTDIPEGSTEKPPSLNVSTCPVCFAYSKREIGCMYMHHNCLESGNYVHMKLYKKFKNPKGEIYWCTICGRICLGHRHYMLSEPTDPVPPFAPVTYTDPFKDDCHHEGGGGLEEKLRRFQRAREIFKRMNPTLPFDTAMDRLIEGMWKAPLSSLPTKETLNTMMAAKKYTNIPTEAFPPNVKPAPEQVIEKTITPFMGSLPILATLPTPVMNSSTLEDVSTILLFQHGGKPDAHANETDTTKETDRIGIIGFFDVLKYKMDKGYIGDCWKHPECKTPLHPDEVDEAARLAATSGLNYQNISKRYRVIFTREFGRESGTAPATAGATGGGQAQPAGGAGLERRTRRARRQIGGGGSVVDLIRSRFSEANAACVLPSKSANRKNRKTRRCKST